MKKPLIGLVGVVVAVAICVGALCFSIVRLQARNLSTARSVAESLTARYPAFGFTGGGGYEQPYIRITAAGVTDKAIRDEIREWLAAEKVRRGLDARIELRFIDRKAGDTIEVGEV